MPDYNWPDAQHRHVIGTRVSRVDGPAKSSGHAKYTYDQNPPGLLFGRLVTCPYAHAKVVSIDTSAAERMPGVKAVKVLQGPGKEIFWAGDEIAAVAAVDEGAAEDAARAVKVEYQPLPHFVVDEAEPTNIAEDTGPISEDEFLGMLGVQTPDQQIIRELSQRGVSFQLSSALEDRLRTNKVPDEVIAAAKSAPQKSAADTPKSPYKKSEATKLGDPDKAFAGADAVSEGLYGNTVITHCCMEAHGTVASWPDKDHVDAQVSTQFVSGIAGEMAPNLGIPASNIHVHQQHMGGGFGSKFGPDRWGIAAAQLSQLAGGQPVKLMLPRAQELQVAGCRPSVYARVKVGATKDGRLVAWESHSWGTGGPGGGGSPPLPYIFGGGGGSDGIPNQLKQHTAVESKIGPARAWRAPNHPQAAQITMSALDDMAAKLNLDPYDFFLKNLDLTPRPKVYAEELAKADELMAWKKRWHPRGDQAAGPVKRGLGLSLHTWGGLGRFSNCDFTIHPDGAVEVKIGTQDIGTGTRTVIMMVAAETVGLKPHEIDLKIGDTNYPSSGGSGGSTTIGGVAPATRRAAIDALAELFAKVAPALKAKPEELEAVNGTIRVKGEPSRSLTWKQACGKLGATAINTRGKNPDASKGKDLLSSGVGGVQMADVSVDTETGIVKVNKMVAVQDCGLVVDLKTAESQCYGALIMGIGYALYEEKIMDPTSGRMLNPNMEFYRLAGYADIPELVVHMMTGPGYDERGVIGLGEPPTVSPGPAISNAVANAIGVRVPYLPVTPDRVLAALRQKEGA